jgi:hypothetical protein
MVVDAYVVEGSDGQITDMVSFYTLPSSILGHPEHTELRAAYMYYTGEGVMRGCEERGKGNEGRGRGEQEGRLRSLS